jgi:type II secretory pathway predicted ATPase ExeA
MPGSLPDEHTLAQLLGPRVGKGKRAGDALFFPWPPDLLRLRHFDETILCFMVPPDVHRPGNAFAPTPSADPEGGPAAPPRRVLMICVTDGKSSRQSLDNGTVLRVGADQIDFSSRDALNRTLVQALLGPENRVTINPFSWNGPCPPSMFFGRVPQLHAVLREPSRSFAVVGPRGSGKSSLLYFLRRSLAEFPGQTYIYVNASGVTSYRELCWLLLSNISGSGRYARDEAALRTSSLDHLLLQTAGRLGARFVVAIDDFDDVAGSGDQDLQKLRALFSGPRLHGRYRFIVAGHSSLWRELSNPSSPYYNCFHPITLGPFAEAEAKVFLVECLGDFSQVLPRWQQAVSRLITLSGGIPWLLQRLCAQVLADALEESPRGVEQLVEEAAAQYDVQKTILELMTLQCSESGHVVLSVLADLPKASEKDVVNALAERGVRLPFDELVRELGTLVMSGAVVHDRLGYSLSNAILQNYLARFWPSTDEARVFANRHPDVRVPSPTGISAATSPPGATESVESSVGLHKSVNPTKDFFVSYNHADEEWANWIAWVLEDAGYQVVIQSWDFRPGSNFVHEIQSALDMTTQVIPVLSPDYLLAEFTAAEWYAAFGDDPKGVAKRILPVRVRECNPTGLLKPIIYVDLVGQSEAQAKASLLAALEPRAKPRRVRFPRREADHAKRYPKE